MRVVKPMLAKAVESSDALDRPGMSWEPKFDGYRLVAEVDGQVRLQSRSGRVVTDDFPTIVSALSETGWRGVLDGEIIVLVDGLPSFNALQNRGSMSLPALEAQMRYVAFDVLDTGGEDMRRLPYSRRRDALEEAVTEIGSACLSSAPATPDGRKLWKAIEEAQMEGVVGKPAGSSYREGERGTWIKVKRKSAGEFTVVGWTRGSGARSGEIGALVLASRLPSGELLYAGKVGTGFDRRSLCAVRESLERLARPYSALADAEAMRATEHAGSQVAWVDPERVVLVEFAEKSSGGVLRFPSYKGMKHA